MRTYEDLIIHRLTIIPSRLAQHEEPHVQFKHDEYEGQRDNDGADGDVHCRPVNGAIEVDHFTRRW